MNYLNLKKNENIAMIEINHQPANALSSDVLKELSMLIDELEYDDDVRVVVLHGKGKFFSAGADIKEFVHFSSEGNFSILSKNGQSVFEKIESLRKPVIAAIHGAALGGGLELAMACHLRLVSNDAKLGLPELQLGIIPGFGGTQRLPKYIGNGRALEMMLTSEPITGEEAVMIGLANHSYPEEILLNEAKRLAAKFAAKSPKTVSAVLSLLNEANSKSDQEGYEKEAIAFGDVFGSSDAKEGISAFIEKREPKFTGE